jgi:chromosome segregation ATPase
MSAPVTSGQVVIPVQNPPSASPEPQATKGCCSTLFNDAGQVVVFIGGLGTVGVGIAGLVSLAVGGTVTFPLIGTSVVLGGVTGLVGCLRIKCLAPLADLGASATKVANSTKKVAKETIIEGQEIKDGGKVVDQLDKSNTDLKINIAAKQAADEQFQVEMAAKVQQVQTLAQQLQNTTQQLTQLQTLYDQLKGVVKLFVDQGPTIKGRASQADKDVQGIAKAAQSIQQSLEKFEQQSKQIADEDGALKKNLDELMSLLTSFQQQIQQIEKDYAAQQAQIKAFESSKSDLQKVLPKVDDEKAQLQAEYKEAQQYFEKREAEIKQLTSLIERLTKLFAEPTNHDTLMALAKEPAVQLQLIAIMKKQAPA